MISPRMWVERYGGRDCTHRSGTSDNRIHYFLVTKMQTVKNTQCEDRRAHDIGILGAVKDLHNRNTDGILGEGIKANRKQM